MVEAGHRDPGGCRLSVAILTQAVLKHLCVQCFVVAHGSRVQGLQGNRIAEEPGLQVLQEALGALASEVNGHEQAAFYFRLVEVGSDL